MARSTIDSCLNMREMVSPFGAFRVNIIAEALADGSDSKFCLAICLVIVGGSHVTVNLHISHELHPKAAGEFWVPI